VRSIFISNIAGNLNKVYGADTQAYLQAEAGLELTQYTRDMILETPEAFRDVDYIFSAPCCQHQFNASLKMSEPSVMTDYGIIRERFCALATDAIRAKLLEACGYKTQIIEFIDFEHSPKNLLIRAKRTGKKSRAPLAEAEEFLKTYPGKNELYELLMADGRLG